MNEVCTKATLHHATQPFNAVKGLGKWDEVEIFIRNPKGITLTRDGMEFPLRQVVEQIDLLSERYKNPVEFLAGFSVDVSSQHYAFVVGALRFPLLKRKRHGKIQALLTEERGLGRSSVIKNLKRDWRIMPINYNTECLSDADDKSPRCHHLFGCSSLSWERYLCRRYR